MKKIFKLIGIIALAAVIGFSMTACGDDDSDGGGGGGGGKTQSDFVAVTNITGVPATATVGTALTLTGTVEPETATNKTITWSVVSGTATVSGSTLTASAAGLVTVKATIANGTAQGTNYTLNFTITVSGGSTGGGNTFTSVTDLGTWLAAQDASTPAQAVTVKLNVNSTDGIYQMLNNNSTKYVSLDFSGSTFTSIDQGIFSFKTNLTSVILPDSVTSLGAYAFRDTSLTSITIPDSVTSIGDGSFYNCTNLTSVTIPDSVTTIGISAFNGCTSLTSVTIGNGVNTIGQQAFSGCTSLTSVTIGNGVNTIGQQAFSGCTSLASLTLGNSLTSVSSDSFQGVNGLTSVNIGTLTTVTVGTASSSIINSFGGGAALTEIIVDPANTDYSSADGVVYNKNKTTLVRYPRGKTGTTFTIPNTVTSIGDGTFNRCTSLTSVTIPNSVTSIGRNSFYGCTSLTSIIIPDSVTSIGIIAFLNCTSLTSVRFERADTTFDATDSNAAFIDGANSTSLKAAYTDGGIGTYTKPNTSGTAWTKTE